MTLVEVAAHTSAGTAILTNAEDSSSPVDNQGRGTIPVPAVHLSPRSGSQPVSLLKMDIEGGEHALLADRDLEKLDVHMLLLEWHNPSGSGS